MLSIGGEGGLKYFSLIGLDISADELRAQMHMEQINLRLQQFTLKTMI